MIREALLAACWCLAFTVVVGLFALSFGLVLFWMAAWAPAWLVVGVGVVSMFTWLVLLLVLLQYWEERWM